MRVTVQTIRDEINRTKGGVRNPIRIELTPAAWDELRTDPLFAGLERPPDRLLGLRVRVWDFDYPCRIVSA